MKRKVLGLVAVSAYLGGSLLPVTVSADEISVNNSSSNYAQTSIETSENKNESTVTYTNFEDFNQDLGIVNFSATNILNGCGVEYDSTYTSPKVLNFDEFNEFYFEASASADTDYKDQGKVEIEYVVPESVDQAKIEKEVFTLNIELDFESNPGEIITSPKEQTVTYTNFEDFDQDLGIVNFSPTTILEECGIEYDSTYTNPKVLNFEEFNEFYFEASASADTDYKDQGKVEIEYVLPNSVEQGKIEKDVFTLNIELSFEANPGEIITSPEDQTVTYTNFEDFDQDLGIVNFSPTTILEECGIEYDSMYTNPKVLNFDEFNEFYFEAYAAADTDYKDQGKVEIEYVLPDSVEQGKIEKDVFTLNINLDF